MTKQTLFYFVMLILLTSCHRYYTSSNFDVKATKHKTIAVLPAEMVFTGNKPQNLSNADIAQIEEAESFAFQQFLYDDILRLAKRNKNGYAVSMQTVINTRALLKEQNFSVRDIWSATDEELCRVLKVDALVRMKIQKNRYMSDLASLGIAIGREIRNQFGNPIFWASNKTNDIIASCTISSTGETLWSDSYTRRTDWNTSANNVISRITNKFARNIPYRVY